MAIACGGDPEGSLPILTEIIGNPDLQPETAENVGLGFAWQFTDDASLVVDYWRIDYENLVGTDEADFLRRAFAGVFEIRDFSAGDAPLPESMPGVEIENGVVVEAHVPLLNFGYQNTDGVDISYTHYWDTDSNGRFRFTFDATYLNSFEQQLSSVSGVEELAGDYSYPEWLATVGARWQYEDWRINARLRYTDSYRDDLTGLRLDTLEEFGLTADSREDVASWTTLDLGVSYDITPSSWIRLNVDNVLDRRAPRVFGSAAGVDFYNHDTMGRYFTLRYTHIFE